MNFTFDQYDTEGFYDEMFNENGEVRPGYTHFKERVEQLKQEEFTRRQQSAERALMAMGITFNVYAENEGTERIMPVVIGDDDKYVGLFHFDLPCLHASAGFQSMPCASKYA